MSLQSQEAADAVLDVIAKDFGVQQVRAIELSIITQDSTVTLFSYTNTPK